MGKRVRMPPSAGFDEKSHGLNIYDVVELQLGDTLCIYFKHSGFLHHAPFNFFDIEPESGHFPAGTNLGPFTSMHEGDVTFTFSDTQDFNIYQITVSISQMYGPGDVDCSMPVPYLHIARDHELYPPLGDEATKKPDPAGRIENEPKLSAGKR